MSLNINSNNNLENGEGEKGGVSNAGAKVSNGSQRRNPKERSKSTEEKDSAPREAALVSKDINVS